MATSLKRLLVGNPLKTEQAAHERLSKKTALAVFSSDALSSTAYATEEILLVLAVAAAATAGMSFNYVVPISVGIAVLLAVVATSYRQTIHAYPSGGGAYIVAKENLGTTPGLVAGASLLVDYVLTVSVSIAAGVAAITSAAQGTRLAWLDEHKVALCLVFIAFIALANLRGVRESGALFAAPTYLFLFSFLFMIGFGLFHYLTYGGAAPHPGEELKTAEGYSLQPLTLFLLLGAFSNGCAALTGIEAISNGVQAFKKPEARNASRTLVWMAVLLTTMFLGTSVLAYFYHVHPKENETVISQFARIMFTGGMGWFYYVVQGATAAILVLAANTAFADFPRLASLLARDRFLPRQFANRGDKLVFSNGIVILAVFSGLLVVAFGGDTSRLIPLYAVGVFLSFTLSQTGMVRHWLKERAELRAKREEKDDEPQGRAMFGAEAEDGAARPVPDVELEDEEIHRSYFVSDEVTAPSNWKKSIAINAVGAARHVRRPLRLRRHEVHPRRVDRGRRDPRARADVPLDPQALRRGGEAAFDRGLGSTARDQEHRHRADLRHPPRRHQRPPVRQVHLARRREGRVRGLRRGGDGEAAREVGAVGLRRRAGGAPVALPRADAPAPALRGSVEA